jgi:hypothetical protein
MGAHHVSGPLTTAVRSGLPVQGTHYVFADDGSNPNYIDTFSLTSAGLRYVSSTPTGGSLSTYGYYGANAIATLPATWTHANCVFHADPSSGNVESFTFDTASQTLSPVSTVSIPGANDVAVGGKYLYALGASSYTFVAATLNAMSIGVGCTLSALTTFTPTGGQSYGSLLPLSASRLAATGLVGGTMDVYSVSHTSDGATMFTWLASTPTLPSPTNLAAASATTTVGTVENLLFDGTFTGLDAQNEVDGQVLDLASGAGSEMPGSPATGIQGFVTGDVYAPQGSSLLTVTDAANRVESFSYANGVLSAVASAPLDPQAWIPVAQVSLGQLLLVENYGSDTISACTISKTGGAGSCQYLASLAYAGNAEGIGVL